MTFSLIVKHRGCLLNIKHFKWYYTLSSETHKCEKYGKRNDTQTDKTFQVLHFTIKFNKYFVLSKFSVPASYFMYLKID